MKTLISGFVLLLLSVGHATAATVGFSPTSPTVTIGQSFSIDIVGDFTLAETIEGGGVDLSFDASVVNVTNVTVNTALFDFFSLSGTIDNNSGTVSDVVFNTFAGASGNFLIATVDLTALTAGSTGLILTESFLNPFSSASAGDSLAVDFQPGNVTVTAVPLPAALVLMLSGLAPFGWLIRRNRRV